MKNRLGVPGPLCVSFLCATRTVRVSCPRWLSLVVQKVTSPGSFIHLLALVTYFPSVSITAAWCQAPAAAGSVTGACGKKANGLRAALSRLQDLAEEPRAASLGAPCLDSLSFLLSFRTPSLPHSPPPLAPVILGHLLGAMCSSRHRDPADDDIKQSPRRPCYREGGSQAGGAAGSQPLGVSAPGARPGFGFSHRRVALLPAAGTGPSPGDGTSPQPPTHVSMACARKRPGGASELRWGHFLEGQPLGPPPEA